MDSHDRRVRRTRASLTQALIDLTLEKSYDAVTIRDLTERADVGYATFFRHYPDKDALLTDTLQLVLTDLSQLLRVQGDLHAEGVVLFDYVQRHSQLCRVLVSNTSPVVLNQLRQAGVRTTLDQMTPNPDAIVPIEVAADHLVSSTIALIRWWLENGMPYPAERMGAIYAELIAQPTHAAAFLTVQPNAATVSAPVERREPAVRSWRGWK